MAIQAARLPACLSLFLLALPLLAQGREPRDMVSWTRIQVVREQGGGPQLQIRGSRGTPTLAIPIPLHALTIAVDVEGGYLVGGTTANGEGKVLAVHATEGRLTLGEATLTLPTYPEALDLKHGRMALWLADGALLAADCAGLEAFPQLEQFERVGAHLTKMGSKGIGVGADERIYVGFHMGKMIFRRNNSGTWERDRERESPDPAKAAARIETQLPARIGSTILVRGAATSFAVLEEEGASVNLPVVLEPAAQGLVGLPAEVSRSLRADRKYRFRTATQQGDWFYPAAIHGAAWVENGMTLGEIHTSASFVTQEWGVAGLAATLGTSPGVTATRIHTVCLVAITQTSEAPIVDRGGRVWLQPTKISLCAQDCDRRITSYALVSSVPIERSAEAVGSWIHAQFAVLDQDHRLLGATGIRSLPVIADSGRITNAQEARSRSMAELFWSNHSVANVAEFWEALVAPR